MDRALSHRQARAARERGFTLIELMVGMAIGILTCVAIAQVLGLTEGYRRGTASGSDAQVVGGVALYTMQREIEMAGYGISSVPSSLGCALSAKFNNKPAAGFATVMAPAVITTSAGKPDSLRLLSSGKKTYSVANRLVVAYDPAGKVGDAYDFKLSGNTLNVKQGDLMIVANPDATQPCEVFQVNGNPVNSLPRTDDNQWNATGFPDTTYGIDGPYVVDLGDASGGSTSLRDVTFSINGDKLMRCDYQVNTQTSNCNELQSGVVNLKVFYGINSTYAGGSASTHDLPPDTYTTTTPTTNTGWQQVRAIRIAVVVRSSQYEKDEVSSKDGVEWVVGGPGGTKIDGAYSCGSQQCVTLATNLDGATDYTHYRYKVFETVVPLRNLVWHS